MQPGLVPEGVVADLVAGGPASAASASRFSASAASWPTTKNVIRSSWRASTSSTPWREDGEVRRDRTPSRRRRGSSCTTTGCRRRATGSRWAFWVLRRPHFVPAPTIRSPGLRAPSHVYSGHAGTHAAPESAAAARSASSTVSFTLSVPLTICAELTRCRPGTLVRERRARAASSPASGSGRRGAPGRSASRATSARRTPGWSRCSPPEEPGLDLGVGGARRAGRPGATYFGRNTSACPPIWAGSTSAVISTTAVNGRSSIRYVR